MLWEPRAKLSYAEAKTLIDLLAAERARVGVICREGVGLQAIAANAESIRLTELHKKISKVRDTWERMA